MRLIKQVERLEVDRAQEAAILSFARQHGISPEDALRVAVSMLVEPTRRRIAMDRRVVLGSAVRKASAERRQQVVVEKVVETNASNLPAGFVSRHPDRDYSSFGSATGVFGDGIEYQKSIREEW